MSIKVYVPPIKIQGIKTKLIEHISKYIPEDIDGTWYEPFMGSGVVGFNLAPRQAVFSDTNPHIISFYKAIQDGNITHERTRLFLEREGSLLRQKDASYYYEVRERFNVDHNPLDFLFLNRSGFNGLIRYNKAHEYNVPYGHKPERFSKGYITKIVNQVKHVEDLLMEHDWSFECCGFRNTIAKAREGDFIYCDPPYIGRNVDYYDHWEEIDELSLRDSLNQTKTLFMLSTWSHNRYRKNEYLDTMWSDYYKVTAEHFYFVGANENQRNSMVEAIVMNYDPTME